MLTAKASSAGGMATRPAQMAQFEHALAFQQANIIRVANREYSTGHIFQV
jgi:hypothetical protein